MATQKQFDPLSAAKRPTAHIRLGSSAEFSEDEAMDLQIMLTQIWQSRCSEHRMLLMSQVRAIFDLVTYNVRRAQA